jgi:S-adenosylmethionine synthetase
LWQTDLKSLLSTAERIILASHFVSLKSMHMPNTQPHFFTSESVSEGHPDKVADQISDAILDAYLLQDPEAKVACECLITTNQCIIAGEVTANASVDPVAIAREVIRDIGYIHQDFGFDADKAQYLNLLHGQSREINHSVADGGAGDQGMMFGYACRETAELMPLAIMLSHRLMQRQSTLRKNGSIPWLLPDAKAQVTVAYEDEKVTGVSHVVLSTQHLPGIAATILEKEVIEQLIMPVIAPHIGAIQPSMMVNPSGSFTIGGPHGDTGLTGRKIIVDTYGGSCAHGGGAFSGKDPSKVDRSAAYMARYMAKQVVASGIADQATIQLAYAIGVAEPVSVWVNTHGTGKIPDTRIAQILQQELDLSPFGIIKTLQLKRPIYRSTASYGHFGRDGFPWEQVNQPLIALLVKTS